PGGPVRLLRLRRRPRRRPLPRGRRHGAGGLRPHGPVAGPRLPAGGGGQPQPRLRGGPRAGRPPRPGRGQPGRILRGQRTWGRGTVVENEKPGRSSGGLTVGRMAKSVHETGTDLEIRPKDWGAAAVGVPALAGLNSPRPAKAGTPTGAASCRRKRRRFGRLLV